MALEVGRLELILEKLLEQLPCEWDVAWLVSAALPSVCDLAPEIGHCPLHLVPISVVHVQLHCEHVVALEQEVVELTLVLSFIWDQVQPTGIWNSPPAPHLRDMSAVPTSTATSITLRAFSSQRSASFSAHTLRSWSTFRRVSTSASSAQRSISTWVASDHRMPGDVCPESHSTSCGSGNFSMLTQTSPNSLAFSPTSSKSSLKIEGQRLVSSSSPAWACGFDSPDFKSSGSF